MVIRRIADTVTIEKTPSSMANSCWSGQRCTLLGCTWKLKRRLLVNVAPAETALSRDGQKLCIAPDDRVVGVKVRPLAVDASLLEVKSSSARKRRSLRFCPLDTYTK